MLVPSLQVKNVPADLHRELRRRAGAGRTTVSNYVLEVLRRDLEVPLWSEWLSMVAQRESAESLDVNAALNAERAAREDL
ncbi:MAG: hypothetical protein ABR564_04285 [Candidatus Dormibacteria bacterium]